MLIYTPFLISEYRYSIMDVQALLEKGSMTRLAPGPIMDDEVSSLSKDSADTTTRLWKRKNYLKNKIKIITTNNSP